MKYCAVYGCNSSSGRPTEEKLSFFLFPQEETVKKAWVIKTRRKFLKPTKNSSICSLHFIGADYTQHRTRKNLKSTAVPSVFNWNSNLNKIKVPRERLIPTEIFASEHTVEHTPSTSTLSTQTKLSGPACFFNTEALVQASQMNPNRVKFFTGFSTMEGFFKVLDLILPNRDGKHIKYYDVQLKKEFCSMQSMFDSDEEYITCTQTKLPSGKKYFSHFLSVEDEFLLVMMKLRLGLFYEDIATRFGISASTVHRIFYSWINFMYCRLGSIPCFPHRDVIKSVMKKDFKDEYGSTMIIIDCTEIKVETPSSLLQQSQTFSYYKSTNTLKGLIGVDSLGGIMFVSQLYSGSISDKEICTRSGFFDILKHKVACGELLERDAIMADKGFNIVKEVEECHLELNIPPFLPQTGRFDVDEVIATRTIAKHRIHVERAIRKIRRFHIFDRRIKINMLELFNQIWLVCCMLTNFQDPVLL